MDNKKSPKQFGGFFAVWTPVALSKAVRHKPVAITVAGERVVLFRSTGGRVAALMDRCPHRGVALSLGKVHPDGTLACPFHGWRFAADGACVKVPLSPTARCERLAATTLATHEAAGLVWIYTAPGETPPGPPSLHESLSTDGFARSILIRDWRTHWTRAMENMLDFPHLPFVHRTTIGSDLARSMRHDSEMEVTWEPTAEGGKICARLDGVGNDGWLEFTRPNHMSLHIPIPVGRLVLHVFCVPESGERTRMILLTARDFLRWLPIGPLLNWFNARVALQDQPVIETSLPAEVPTASLERSVANDKPTLAFRKYYFDLLREPRTEASRLVALHVEKTSAMADSESSPVRRA